MTARLELLAIPGLPMVEAGDDLPALILAGLDRAGMALQPRDVVVIAQKVVSKAEGRMVDLAEIVPTARAVELAAQVGKDPRIVEVVLSDSAKVVRSRPNLMIMQHRLGFVMANAGVDQSNVHESDGRQRALLLPLDPDGSAERIRQALSVRAEVAVVISDSFGRPWRRGTAGVAIGAAGLPSLIDLRGKPDLFGRTLEVSIIGFADEIAAAASLLQGQANEAQPVVILRGLSWTAPNCPVADVIRPPEEDLFQ
ncbi:MAG TPA: coenzyme F420-0:L-glutamate ligase [Rhodopila sp.]|uniref:coenzyme F420-0:L-glutamate ligase n=1 Tax=Rhodopila sp. TaxID=2480087 RepID=UPI002BAD935D|nr:coenzyme F420-0:L-glutamate ligase [Rhodopila sp.]HVY13915.1 coenzyme F420-0:L-glutamate ligase [Rhodopila sp.]